MTDPERLPAAALTERISGVEVFRWMPRRFVALPDYQPENFGDSLAREIVAGLAATHRPSETPRRSRRLLSIGSILHFARGADTVWGSGINGKVDDPIGSLNIDVRAVRGPKTRAALLERGVAAPAVYGDPGLLLPELFPATREWARQKRHRLAIVPNFNDALEFASMPDFVNPLGPLWEVIRRIAQSDFVIASSLHGIIVAEALGVPVRPLRSAAESSFKYDDYAQGTGRASLESAPTVAEALAVGPIAPLSFDTGALRNAFPFDLWQNFEHTHILESGAARDPAALHAVLAGAGDRDEFLLSIEDTSDETLAPLRQIAAEHSGVRLIGTPQESRGARLNAAFSWARGTTVSVLGKRETRVAESLRVAADALVGAGAALAFTKVQEYAHGPDEYAWAGRPSDAAAESMSARPDLLTYSHPSGIVFDTDAMRQMHWQFADRDDHVLLSPLAKATQQQLPVIALDTVSVLHRRDGTPPSADLADTLLYFSRVVEQAPRAELRDAVLSLVPAAWRHSSAIRDADGVRDAAAALLQTVPNRPNDADSRRTVGLLYLASIGCEDFAAAGFGAAAADCSINEFAGAARALNRSPNVTGAVDAAIVLTSLAGFAARGADRDQLETLRASVLDLDFVLRPDHNGNRPEGTHTALLTAALQRDLTNVAVLVAQSGDIRIEKTVQTPFGWAVSGTAAATLADPSLRIWVQDVASDAEQMVGRMRFDNATKDGRAHFTGVIRSIGAPAGMLVVRAKDGGPSHSIETARHAAGKFVQQMLHPVELPLDGGQALLVRRTLPLNAVRARARQQS